MKFIVIISITLMFVMVSFAQDSTETDYQQTKIGLGGEFAGVTVGPHIMCYWNGLLASFTYGFSSSNSSNGVIKELAHSMVFRGGYTIGSWGSPQSFWPIYLGAAYSFATEKNQVLTFNGDGSITGLSLLIGTRALRHNTEFLSGVGAHIEVGYTIWNYSNSILAAHNRSSDYSYSKFFFSMGAYIYIK